MSFNPIDPFTDLDKSLSDPSKRAQSPEISALSATLFPKCDAVSPLSAHLKDLISPPVLSPPSLLADVLSPKSSLALGDPLSPALTPALEAALPKPLEILASPATAALSVAIQPKPFSLLTGFENKPMAPLLSDLLKPVPLGFAPSDLLSPSDHLAMSTTAPSLLAPLSLTESLSTRPMRLLEPLVDCVPETLRLPEVLEASRLTKLMDDLLLPRPAMSISAAMPFEGLHKDFQRVGDTYTAFLRAVPAHQIEPTLFPIPSRSYFQSGDLFLEIPTGPPLSKSLQRARESTRAALRTYAETRLERFLDKVNPGFRKMWDGAHMAATSNNPDKIRHAMISLRELFTHVIHTLAPDADVKRWTTDPRRFHQGRPTRETRLLYICSPVAAGPLSDFVVTDVQSILALAKLFQHGTHAIEPTLSPVQMRLIFRRLEGVLCNLIDISTASD